jgi:nitroimidazol reductase NimA-like FMN-containing flavoprotein (pyridoxamine 5'-phosphate oxidase superfamily)
MSDSGDLRHLVGGVLAAQRFCVLATAGHGQPYGSLVAFAAAEDLKQLVFATSRETRKFSNLMSEPRVALVIDSRSNTDTDLRDAVAVTALGPAREASGVERKRLAGLYLAKHPVLEEFIGWPATALCVVTVDDYVVARFSEVARLLP